MGVRDGERVAFADQTFEILVHRFSLLRGVGGVPGDEDRVSIMYIPRTPHSTAT